jgi:hypothetical protein
MTKRNGISKTFKRAAPFAAGVLIGLSVVTPVFGATLDIEALQPLLLLGSLVVLLGGLILKSVATAKSPRGTEKVDAQTLNSRDLRWSPSTPAVDFALPEHSLRY